MTTIRISASALKLFRECPRAWYRQHVLKVEREQKSYLTKGDDFDAAIRQHVEGVTPTPATELAARQLHAVRVGGRLPAGRGNAQFKYLVSAGDGILVAGAADVRDERLGPGGLVRVIKDTKTTSDRGPNRGADAQRPAYALTDDNTPGGDPRPLALDWQARLYAWCEFTMADAGTAPPIALVEAEWLYVSKAKSPAHWASLARFEREPTLAWFETEVRPLALRMRELAESGLPDSGVGANPDSCRRCLVAVGCEPFAGAQVSGTYVPLRRSGSSMAFDVSKLKAGFGVATVGSTPDGRMTTQAEPDLESALAASLEEVAINRPKAAVASVEASNTADAATPPSGLVVDGALTVSTIEGPGAAYLALEFEPANATQPAVDALAEFTTTPLVPRRRRSRKQSEGPAADPNALIVAELRANLAQQAEMLDRLAKALGVSS